MCLVTLVMHGQLYVHLFFLFLLDTQRGACGQALTMGCDSDAHYMKLCAPLFSSRLASCGISTEGLQDSTGW